MNRPAFHKQIYFEYLSPVEGEISVQLHVSPLLQIYATTNNILFGILPAGTCCITKYRIVSIFTFCK
jgi:hypothetical protein